MADITVDPGGGADYTTLAAAVAAAGPDDWVVLLANITESLEYTADIRGYVGETPPTLQRGRPGASTRGNKRNRRHHVFAGCAPAGEGSNS